MKILYVTALPTPLQEVLEGKDQISALPGFYYPMKMLLEKGHEVNFVLLSNRDIRWNPKVDWISRANVKALIRYQASFDGGAISSLKSKSVAYIRFMQAVHEELKTGSYDFVYCKATEALGGQIVANLHHVPVGVRWFGDLISDDIIKHGVWGAAFRRPRDFLGFKTRCSFMLMTDDNPTKGHRYKAWLPRRRPYPLYIWKSGIEFKELEDLKPTIPVPEDPYIFYAARFDPWKRQDRVVEILRLIHSEGPKISLYLAGKATNETYLAQVRSLVQRYGLEGYVHFLGPIPNDDVRNLAAHAVSNHFMCDKTLNLGNVFFEKFSTGSVIIAIDDGSLDDYIDDKKNGFLVRDEEEAKDVVLELLADPDSARSVRENARRSARQSVLSAEERFGNEIRLIESCARPRGGRL